MTQSVCGGHSLTYRTLGAPVSAVTDEGRYTILIVAQDRRIAVNSREARRAKAENRHSDRVPGLSKQTAWP